MIYSKHRTWSSQAGIWFAYFHLPHRIVQASLIVMKDWIWRLTSAELASLGTCWVPCLSRGPLPILGVSCPHAPPYLLLSPCPSAPSKGTERGGGGSITNLILPCPLPLGGVACEAQRKASEWAQANCNGGRGLAWVASTRSWTEGWERNRESTHAHSIA